jgi:hypothetical protein
LAGGYAAYGCTHAYDERADPNHLIEYGLVSVIHEPFGDGSKGTSAYNGKTIDQYTKHDFTPEFTKLSLEHRRLL